MRFLLLWAAAIACLAGSAVSLLPPAPFVVERGEYVYAYYTIPSEGLSDFGYDAASKICTDNNLYLLTLEGTAEYEALFVGKDALFSSDSLMFKGSGRVWLGLQNLTKDEPAGNVTWSDGKDHPAILEPEASRIVWIQQGQGAGSCEDQPDKRCSATLWFYQLPSPKALILYYSSSTSNGLVTSRSDLTEYWNIVCKGQAPLRGVCYGAGFCHMACYEEDKTVLAVKRAKTECMTQFFGSAEGDGCTGDIYFEGHNQFGCGTFLNYKFNTKSCREAYLEYEPNCQRIVDNGLLDTRSTPFKTEYRCLGW